MLVSRLYATNIKDDIGGVFVYRKDIVRFLLLGDVHGRWHDLNSVMKNVDFNLKIKYDAVIQVGDFAFFNQKMAELDEAIYTSKQPRMLPLKFHKPVYAIDGNHEDHAWLLENKPNWELWKEKYNIHYQPRGSIMDISGFKIGFIGGALHADRKQEGSTAKRTTNYILNNEINEIIPVWNASGINVVISHSCPNRIGIGMEGHPALYMSVQRYCVEEGFDSGSFSDCGEAPLRVLYHALQVKPTYWIYGHFHKIQQKLIDSTNFWCIGSTDSSDGRKYIKPFILDTVSGEIEYHDKMALNFDGMHTTYIK